MVDFVNCVSVPAGREEEFFPLWLEVNAYMTAKPGYLGHSLYRSLAPDATFRYVNHAQWESPEACQAAHDQGFRELAGELGRRGFTSTPALYTLVHEGIGAAAGAAAGAR